MIKLKTVTAEELMVIYQKDAPDNAYMAFVELYSRFSGRVYKFIKNKNLSQADIEDILQKVFFKIHESKHLYNDKFKFEQWIFVIARTTIIDFVRKESRNLKNIEKLIYGKEVNDLADYKEIEELDFFEKLEIDQQKLLELKYVDDLSYNEIAKILNKSEISLRKIVSRLVVKIRNGEV
jgi:RNA polymerase sigma-70 factor (ECF subfamily)